MIPVMKLSFGKANREAGFGQLLATWWLGLGEAETPMMGDKREMFDFRKLASRRLPLSVKR